MPLERAEVGGDELGLLVAALPADARCLDHAHHVQPVERRREDVEVQARRPPCPIEVGARDERVVQRVARREEHQVVLAGRAVAEAHGTSVEPVDVGANAQVALTEVVEDHGVHDGMRLVQLVVGLREAEPHRVAGERAQHALVHELLDGRGQGAALVEGVGGPAEQVPRHEVVPATHAHLDRRGVVHGIDGDVAAGVAGADDEYPLARQLRRRLVRAGVQQLARELAAEGRHVRLGERAVGQDHPVVPLRDPARTRGFLRPQHPPFAVALERRDLRVEAEPVGQSEPIGELAEVGDELAVARIVGGGSHRELGELGRRAR